MYVSAETCVCGCDLPAVPPQHGNVDAELFEKFCFELNDILNKRFPCDKYSACLFIIDGAKSHKRLLIPNATGNDNMAKMRQYLRDNITHAPDVKTWDEQAKGADGKKLSKAGLWAICKAMRDSPGVQPAYYATQILRWGRTHPVSGLPLPGHEVIFTPPYHPELQVKI